MNAESALRSRDALESLLRAHGLAAHAAWLAHEVARFGLRILPGSGRERSTLGGPALVPVGQRWPRTDGGRPLVCLAIIDLSELPAFDERHRWPASGRLLFYADIELDEIEVLYLEHAENADGERARVLYAPPGVDVISVHPPGRTLRWRTARFQPTLTPPEHRDPHGPVPNLGLDVADLRKYDRVLSALTEADPSNNWAADHWPPQHWIGGHRGDYQPETTVLLNLNADTALNFEFMDGGVIRFEIPSDDLARSDFTRATAIGDPE